MCVGVGVQATGRADHPPRPPAECIYTKLWITPPPLPPASSQLGGRHPSTPSGEGVGGPPGTSGTMAGVELMSQPPGSMGGEQPNTALPVLVAPGTSGSTNTVASKAPVTQRSRGLSTLAASRRLAAGDDAKLIFGAVFSLRNMVRKLGGDDDAFISYRTAQYKLHYYETPSSLRFAMLTEPAAPGMRNVLHQIYINLWVEYGECFRDLKTC